MFVSGVALVLLTITAVKRPRFCPDAWRASAERGILQLLLTSTATPREIVEGRLLGKLSQVAMIVLGGPADPRIPGPARWLESPPICSISLLLLAP